MRYKFALITFVLVAGLTMTLVATHQASAQGPNPPSAGRGFAMPLVCSTTDYTDVAAKALGMTAPDLRVALVSGKTLQDLATSKNVTMDTVQQALNTAFKADLDQAVKDGLITQQMADAMQQIRQGNQTGRQFPMPFFGRMGFFGDGVSAYNVVRVYPVAAQAIGVTCADLVKAEQQGSSIVQVATSKNVKAQTVIDALVKAYQDAAAQDVKDGLITQAQADARNARLVERVTQMISRPGGRFGMFGRQRGMGPRGPRGGQPGGQQGGQQGGQPGQPGQQGTPEAPATPQ